MKNSIPTVGSVAITFVFDPNGGNPKRRPVLVIDVADQCLVAAISTSFAIEAVAPTEILLPFGPHCLTGLNCQSVVKCDWLAKIPIGELRVIGKVSAARMEPILNLVLKKIKGEE